MSQSLQACKVISCIHTGGDVILGTFNVEVEFFLCTLLICNVLCGF